MALRILILLALAWLAPYFAERALFMARVFGQKPGNLIQVDSFRSHRVEFADEIRNCEDVVMLEEEGLAITACDSDRDWYNTVMDVSIPHEMQGASLYLYDYKQDAPRANQLQRFRLIDFAAGTDFHTLGLRFNPSTRHLYVVNHAQAGPRIEVFRLDLGAVTATHLGSIQHPLLHAPNSMSLLGDDEMYVTNDHYFVAEKARYLSYMETYLGPPLATLVHIKLRHHTEVEAAQVVARVPFANGVAVVNATTVAVASTSRGSIHLFERAADASQTLHQRSRVALPFLADNLSRTRSGKLLVAGHGYPPALNKYTHTRHICNDEAKLAAAEQSVKEYCARGTAVSAVAEWSQEGGLRLLYFGDEYPSAATAVKDEGRGVGIVAGLYARGLFVWRD
ncbi:hypothetical protein CDD81_1633 [Ophiocordyceps australis]|uniref:Paraoxonase n=1 Tax=Ophiocordyceps australis TaxID=1399860 RepID=A0A2C5XF95_9HYPO|nr:hypothetical protein CDD81_1633 [Ophiocordyceps australis]